MIYRLGLLSLFLLLVSPLQAQEQQTCYSHQQCRREFGLESECAGLKGVCSKSEKACLPESIPGDECGFCDVTPGTCRKKPEKSETSSLDDDIDSMTETETKNLLKSLIGGEKHR